MRSRSTDPVVNLGFLVSDVARLWVRRFRQHGAVFGMTLTHSKVLICLSRNQGTTQARLAALSDTEPMTLVRVLDQMERDDWLERRPDPKDRRAHRLYLKPAAAPVLAEIDRIADKAHLEELAGLSREERTSLVSLLERVQANLTALVTSSNDSRCNARGPLNDQPARRTRRSAHRPQHR